MKKITVFVYILILSVFTTLSGCADSLVTGSGDLATREYDFTGFSQIEVGSSFRVELTQSDAYYVAVTADDNLFPHISVSQKDARLMISLQPDKEYLDTTQKVAIAMPVLERLELVGVSYGNASGFNSAADLDITMSAGSYLQLEDITAYDVRCSLTGASEISGDLIAHNVVCYLSGASKILLQGSATSLTVDASETSRIRLGAFEVEYANVMLTDGSNGAVCPVGVLDFDLSGASSLGYCSDPILGALKKSADSTLMAIGHIH